MESHPAERVFKVLLSPYVAEYWYAYLASLAESKAGIGFDILAQAAPPAGLNELALKMIKGSTAFSDLRHSLDAVLERFGEQPVVLLSH